MEREASLHIRERGLVIVLQEVLPNKKGNPIQWEHDKLARAIMEKGKSYTCNSRGVAVTNNKLEQKVAKMQLATRSNTAKFAQMLTLVRRRHKHRGIQTIKVGEADWLNLKEVCKLATEFCNEFQIGMKEGYMEYITLGLQKMKNFSIYKFKTIHSAICNQYEAIQEIKSDKTPEKTEQAHDIYLAIVGQKVGWSQGYKDTPEKYKYFMYAKQDAVRLRASIKQFIQAQFDGLAWANSIPDPMQLSGVKAIERYQKYAFTNNITNEPEVKKVNFKMIKRRKYGKHRD